MISLRHFHAHADVNRARLMRDIVGSAQMLFEPIRAAATRGDDGMFGVNFLIDARSSSTHDNALADVVFKNQIAAFAAKEDLHAAVRANAARSHNKSLALFPCP